jgi:hypothetical protein
MAPAGLPDLARRTLSLEDQVSFEIARTRGLLSHCPPAIAVLASLEEDLAGLPRALDGAVGKLGEAGSPSQQPDSMARAAQDVAASTALASLGGLLTEAALTCATLHAVAHRAYESTGDGSLEDLADAHLLAYMAAAAAIGEAVSDLSVWELEQAGMQCACHCSLVQRASVSALGTARKPWRRPD